MTAALLEPLNLNYYLLLTVIAKKISICVSPTITKETTHSSYFGSQEGNLWLQLGPGPGLSYSLGTRIGIDYK